MSKIEEAKAALPLPLLMRRLGDLPDSVNPDKPFVICSPLREDRNPSFSVFRGLRGWRWSDKATAEGGDELDYLAAKNGCEFEAALAEFCSMAGVAMNGRIPFRAGRPLKAKPDPLPARAVPEPEVEAPIAFCWQTVRDALGETDVEEIARWRGYRPEMVRWLRDNDLLGIRERGAAIPVQNFSGEIVSCHFRTDRGWSYPKGTKPTALVIGDPSKAGCLVLMESQWDAFAALDLLDAPNNDAWREMIAFAVSRGANNAALLEPVIAKAKGAMIVAFEQNDPPPDDGKPYGNWLWTDAVARLSRGILFAKPPAGVKDLNDWLRTGASRDELFAAMEAGVSRRTTKLSFRSVSSILGEKMSDSDCWIGDYMIAAGQPTSFLGPGGIGKSRLVLQLAVQSILGKEWLGFDTTRAAGKRWMLLQTENSLRRLQNDLRKMIAGLELTPAEVRQLDRSLFIHTIESDNDSMLDLSNPDAFAECRAAVFDFAPDVVMFDPLNTFTSADLNSDRDCREVIGLISSLTRRGDPMRVPFVIHHSLTGKDGAARAVGWDRSSFGRNSKALHAWVRSQWNLAPVDPDSPDRLVLACGKNNNGREFPEFGIMLDDDRGIYLLDPEWNAEEFRDRIGAARGGARASARPQLTIDDVMAYVTDEWTRVGAIQRRACEETGMSRSQFYRVWSEISQTSRIVRNEAGLVRQNRAL